MKALQYLVGVRCLSFFFFSNNRFTSIICMRTEVSVCFFCRHNSYKCFFSLISFSKFHTLSFTYYLFFHKPYISFSIFLFIRFRLLLYFPSVFKRFLPVFYIFVFFRCFLRFRLFFLTFSPFSYVFVYFLRFRLFSYVFVRFYMSFFFTFLNKQISQTIVKKNERST